MMPFRLFVWMDRIYPDSYRDTEQLMLSREAYLQPGCCHKAKCEFESHSSDKKVKKFFDVKKEGQVSITPNTLKYNVCNSLLLNGTVAQWVEQRIILELSFRSIQIYFLVKSLRRLVVQIHLFEN